MSSEFDNSVRQGISHLDALLAESSKYIADGKISIVPLVSEIKAYYLSLADLNEGPRRDWVVKTLHNNIGNFNRLFLELKGFMDRSPYIHDRAVGSFEGINKQLDAVRHILLSIQNYRQTEELNVGAAKESISRINSMERKLSESLDGVTSNIDKKMAEVEEIARERLEEALKAIGDAAALSGAAGFEKHYEEERAKNRKEAMGWMYILFGWIMIGVGATAFIAILVSRNIISFENYEYGIIVASLSIFFYFATFISRNYKASRHNEIVNSHRAVGLRTLESFVSAPSSKEMRDEVLRQAASAVYSPQPTGYGNEKEKSEGGEQSIVVNIPRGS